MEIININIALLRFYPYHPTKSILLWRRVNVFNRQGSKGSYTEACIPLRPGKGSCNRTPRVQVAFCGASAVDKFKPVIIKEW